MTARRIALIGFGAIASDLLALLMAQAGAFEVAVLLAAGSATRERVPDGCPVLADVPELAAFAPSLVVEAAGQEAVRALVPQCLERGFPVLVSSVGALHDDALFATLVSLATRHGGRILLPSGALGGLDYIRAARGAPGLSVRYESRKPPSAWREELAGRGHDPDDLREPVTLYRGDARGAAAAYPANLNVAATLALAGCGFEGTQVSVVVDPLATGNTHVIAADSELGTFRAEIVNRPSPVNPKTSRIVARSLLAAIRQHFAVVAML